MYSRYRLNMGGSHPMNAQQMRGNYCRPTNLVFFLEPLLDQYKVLGYGIRHPFHLFLRSFCKYQKVLIGFEFHYCKNFLEYIWSTPFHQESNLKTEALSW